MAQSKSVSTTVSVELEAKFWDIISSKLGVSQTTKYDWTKTDSETKSEMKSYSVEVIIPARTKVQIQEAVGTCGGSTIHTQLFR